MTSRREGVIEEVEGCWEWFDLGGVLGSREVGSGVERALPTRLGAVLVREGRVRVSAPSGRGEDRCGDEREVRDVLE